VTLLFDGDAAGRKAVRLSREPCTQAGLSVKVATLPDGVDPDDFARTKGVEALNELLTRGKGMLEFLIDAALDESFSAADAHEKLERVERIAKLLASEDDPLIRMMAKGYADRLAGRLDMHQAMTFQALEEKVRKAVPRATNGAGGPDPRNARITQKIPGAAERREMVGALIEFPALLNDADVQVGLELLEGPAALAVAALRGALVWRDGDANRVSEGVSQAESGEGMNVSNAGEITLDTSRFLAQIPPAIQAFASERLAAPQYDSEGDAKDLLLGNAAKLRGLILERETKEIARDVEKAQGDPDVETSLLREALGRARQKHGLK
jgi:DNA primase